MRRYLKKRKQLQDEAKDGFTLIEVMLVLGIGGLMLVGLIGGSFAAIARQRYNDSVQGVAEFIRTMYNEVINPETLNYNDGIFVGGNSKDQAILGKIIVFGHDGSNVIQYATLVGNASIDRGTSRPFLEEITDNDAGAKLSIFCGDESKNIPSSVQTYTPLWEAELQQANGMPNGAEFPNEFAGTMIIARTPTSSAVHTIFSPEQTYDLEGDCRQSSTRLATKLKEQHDGDISYPEAFGLSDPVGICVVSDNSRVYREVRIAADGRNTSAVWLRSTDDPDKENRCEVER